MDISLNRYLVRVMAVANTLLQKPDFYQHLSFYISVIFSSHFPLHFQHLSIYSFSSSFQPLVNSLLIRLERFSVGNNINGHSHSTFTNWITTNFLSKLVQRKKSEIKQTFLCKLHNLCHTFQWPGLYQVPVSVHIFLVAHTQIT